MDVEALHRHLKRLLICLGFPEAETFDILGTGAPPAPDAGTSGDAPASSPLASPLPLPQPQLVRLVTWLEDRKIRGLEVQERDGIRQASSAQEWDKAMQKVRHFLIASHRTLSSMSLLITIICFVDYLGSHTVTSTWRPWRAPCGGAAARLLARCRARSGWPRTPSPWTTRTTVSEPAIS